MRDYTPSEMIEHLHLENEELREALAEARRASRTRPDYDLRCTACGAPHWLDTSIPSGVWNRIAGDDEILCVLCIDARVTAAGLTSECEFYFVGAAITSRGYHESFGELAEARRVWTIEEAIEGEGTYTLAICASREVAEAIVAGLRWRPVGVEEVEPVTDAAAWLRETA